MSERVTEKPASAVSTMNGRIGFVLGGSLLIGSTAVVLIARFVPLPDLTFTLLGSEQHLPTLAYAALFAAGLLVFAWGWRGEGSVVARRPIGVFALSLFGLWNLLVALFAPPVLAANPGETAAAYLIIFGLPVLQFIVGLIGIIAIVRARTVPGGWRWLPLLAFIPYTVVLVATSLSYVFYVLYAASALVPVAVLGILGAHVLVGAAAIGLAIAARKQSHALSAGQPDEPHAEQPPASDIPETLQGSL